MVFLSFFCTVFQPLDKRYVKWLFLESTSYIKILGCLITLFLCIRLSSYPYYVGEAFSPIDLTGFFTFTRVEVINSHFTFSVYYCSLPPLHVVVLDNSDDYLHIWLCWLNLQTVVYNVNLYVKRSIYRWVVFKHMHIWLSIYILKSIGVIYIITFRPLLDLNIFLVLLSYLTLYKLLTYDV